MVAATTVAALAFVAGLQSSAKAEDVIIGFAIAQSGWMDAYDGPPLIGAMMAIDDFNAEGGILGNKIDAVVSDTKTDAVQGAKAGTEVIAKGANFMVVSCDYDMGARPESESTAPWCGSSSTGRPHPRSGACSAPRPGRRRCPWCRSRRHPRRAAERSVHPSAPRAVGRASNRVPNPECRARSCPRNSFP
jgi:branched-chain amino acid transport system substrate-binding protein